MAAAVQVVDEIIKEYLLFRGFANTLKAFEAELKLDKDKSFRVNKIVEQLITFVQYYDLQGIREYWSYLKRRFFSRLDSVHLQNAHKLEKCLYRFYLVNAVQTSRPDKVTDFFEKMTSELQNQADWKEWFALPFLKSPEQNPSLDMYFSSLWQETFPLSLHNFLNAIFQSMPLPRLLKFDAERIISEKLKQDNNHLHKKIVILEQEISVLQGNKEKKPVATTKDLDPQPKSKVTGKETKPKEKETAFIPRRFRKGKDNQDKRKSQALEQELTTTENLQTKTVEKKDCNLDQENRGFDMPQNTNTKADGGLDVDSTRSSGGENESSKKRDESKLDSQSSQNRPTPEFDTVKTEDFDAEVQPKEKRSQSWSLPKTTPRRDAMKRVHSNMSQNSYREMTNLSTYPGKTTIKENSEEPFLVLGEETYTEHRSPIVQCDFSPSGKMVSSVDLDGIVKVWKHQPVLSTVATVMSKSSILCTEWASKTDKALLLGTSNGKIRLYDTETKTTRFESTENQHSRIVSLACSPSGTSFVCSSTVESKSSVSSVLKQALLVEQDKHTEGALLLWDLKTMKLDRYLPLRNNTTRINCIAYNHNGTLLVTGGADGVIRIYDIISSACLMSWSAHSSQVTSVQFSVDETSVFSLGKDNQFLQWCLRKMGHKIASIVAHDGVSGPRDHTIMTSSRAKPALFSRLFTFDCKGDHLLTCAPTSGIIYKYNESEHVLSQVFSIGESKSHVTSVDWNTAIDCITCLTGCLSGPIRMTTLLKQ